MNPTIAHRFETEFAPRIAQVIASTFGARVEITPYGGADSPTTMTISGPRSERQGHLGHPLNVRLTWDAAEIANLMANREPERFARYLSALPGKLKAWQDARQIDFQSRSQAEPDVLIGNLDFEG
ncbi:MAG TPA: DUF5594 family protein [Trinickia sp.]|nr:DUF5594 family protein [Trinickia sp.]